LRRNNKRAEPSILESSVRSLKYKVISEFINTSIPLNV